jgi:TolA-binding protein
MYLKIFHYTMAELVEQLSNLAKEIQELRKQMLLLQKQRDDYKRELDKLFHAWGRDDLEEWGASNGVKITEALWRNWCNSWMDIYNLQNDQEAMEMAMNDWWENRKLESLDPTN